MPSLSGPRITTVAASPRPPAPPLASTPPSMSASKTRSSAPPSPRRKTTRGLALIDVQGGPAGRASKVSSRPPTVRFFQPLDTLRLAPLCASPPPLPPPSILHERKGRRWWIQMGPPSSERKAGRLNKKRPSSRTKRPLHGNTRTQRRPQERLYEANDNI